MNQLNRPPAFPPEDDSIDVKRYISLLISNWYWFAIAFFLALTLAYGINRYSEKIFTVSSTMLIKDDRLSGGISGMEGFLPGGDYFRNQQTLSNEIGILKSFMLHQRVVDELEDFHVTYVGIGRRNIVETRKYLDCPFRVVYSPVSVTSFGKKVNVRITGPGGYKIEGINDEKMDEDYAFGEQVILNGFNFSIRLTDSASYVYDPDKSNKYYFMFERVENLANVYRNKLAVTPVEENASLIRLMLTGPVPGQEADYLNKLMDLYLDLGLEFKNQTADSTLNFIDEQIDTIADFLQKAEDALEIFRRNNKLLDLSREGGLIQGRVERYETEKNTLILQLKYYEYLSEYIDSRKESGDIVSPTVMGINDVQLINLIQQLAGLQQQKQRLSVNLNRDIEPVRVLTEAIMDVRKAMRENVTGGISRIQSSLDDVNGRLALLENEIEKLPATEREMITIQRNFDVNNTVYTYLLEKRAEAGIAKASTVPDNRIIDRAQPYNASLVKPRIRRNYMLAIILSLVVPALIIILIDAFNNKIIDKRDIEKRTTVPVIGFVSHSSFREDIPVYARPQSTLAEAFRSIRTKLKYFLARDGSNIIAISSTISAEGKTFISVNLATIIAMLGGRVLLVGLDLRKPRIHRVLNCDNNKGVSTFLIGQDTYEDIIQPTEVENLFYAPAGPVPPNPAELLAREGMKQFFERAGREYDYVIIDTPPIAVVTDALVIADYVDLYLLVVRQRYSSRNTLNLIEELNEGKTVRNMGIIINDISLSGYYGYGLRYGYYYTYGYKYGYNYYGYYVKGKYGGGDANEAYYSDDE